MVRRVVWSPEARAEHDAYIDWIAERDDAAGRRIQIEIETWTERPSAHPDIGNEHRWPGFRVHGKPKRHKLVIYEVFDDRIEIAGFRDMRQDSSKLRLRPKRK